MIIAGVMAAVFLSAACNMMKRWKMLSSSCKKCCCLSLTKPKLHRMQQDHHKLNKKCCAAVVVVDDMKMLNEEEKVNFYIIVLVSMGGGKKSCYKLFHLHLRTQIKEELSHRETVSYVLQALFGLSCNSCDFPIKLIYWHWQIASR